MLTHYLTFACLFDCLSLFLTISLPFPLLQTMSVPQDLLPDGSPLIGAARLGKLRLVRLLLEGGAQVNERNPGGETPLLAACKALRGEPTGPGTLKLLRYLLDNQADPNAQDRSGRTALMYSCMERAGAQLASTLLSAGADPSMEDYSGASAMVYAINAQHQPTLQVLLDACRAKGRDIIIITTEMGVSGGPVTRRYLNVLPSPDASPVTCMSPSDIIIKTGSPNSLEGENVFNFRGSGKRGSGSSSRFSPCELSPVDQSCITPPRQRQWSEPWLAIHNLARLNKVYQEGRRERKVEEEKEGREEGGKGEKGYLDHGLKKERREKAEQEEEVGDDKESQSVHLYHKEITSGASCSLLFPTEEHLFQAAKSRLSPERRLAPGGSTLDLYREHPSTQTALHCRGGSNLIGGDPMTRKCSVDRLPPCSPSRWQGARRNTLPSLTPAPPLLHLPPLSCHESHLQVPPLGLPVAGVGMVCRTQMPSPSPLSLTPPLFRTLSSSPALPFKAIFRPGFLPPLPLSTSSSSSVFPPLPPSSERSPRRHSIQLEPLRGDEERRRNRGRTEETRGRGGKEERE
ncbi:ankyrin repeat domain-containing protein 34B-like isoform X1 [Salvelinus fontinalis]|uniref:ankyrin repeat domain-containing protein 34B-like isoform X1 n=2 Tax=Salvelinus fontinalis TaxID=8038 RepID=UPI0024857780|nr:ankyrin repeat domain-containing protein 34B-like isoform X1 [Salvelinus fontinalis]